VHRFYFFPNLIFPHLARCAAAILFLPAALILRRARVNFGFFQPLSKPNTCVNLSISFFTAEMTFSKPMYSRFADARRDAKLLAVPCSRVENKRTKRGTFCAD
jgi:hypothetical protein